MSNLENDLVDGPAGIMEEEDLEPPKETSADSLRIIEAVLFASDELLSTARLKAILPGNPDAREIGRLVEKINRQLQNERHPFEIVEIGGGYQFKTVAYYHPWVRQIFKEKASKRLSIQALECLSIIAYRQPLSKAEVEAIRGVLSDGAMKTLLEKRLVTITGRSEKPGRPLLYGTTPEFLKYFGLNKIGDLPKIEEFEAMVREKMEGMGFDELKNVKTLADQEAIDEATIEVALPQEKAAGGAADAREGATTPDAGVFEVTVADAPSESAAQPAAPAPVMEAETVLQPVVRDERHASAAADGQPVVTVKKKKPHKKQKTAPTIIAADDTRASRTLEEEDTVFDAAPESGKTVATAGHDASTPQEETDAVFEANPAPGATVDATAETSVDQPRPSRAESDEAVFDIGAADAGDTAVRKKDNTNDAGDAVFEVKM